MAYPALMPFEGPLQGESWRAVPDFPGYEVSDFGRVLSLAKIIEFTRVQNGREQFIRRPMPTRLLRPGIVKSGHLIVILGRGNGRLVHRLVLEAFVGPRPDGMESLHHDGDPTNNCLVNLRWGTRLENIEDAIRHGTKPRGENHSAAKLTDQQVREMRRLWPTVSSQYELAEMFNISQGSVSRILSGHTWKHVVEIDL